MKVFILEGHVLYDLRYNDNQEVGWFSVNAKIKYLKSEFNAVVYGRKGDSKFNYLYKLIIITGFMTPGKCVFNSSTKKTETK